MRRSSSRNRTGKDQQDEQTPAPVSAEPVNEQAPSPPAAEPDRDQERSTSVAKESVDQLLKRLEEGTRVAPDGESTGLAQIATEAEEHAGALRATLSAQTEAQEMLTMATRVRGAASEQAEKIVREAQEAAERLKDEARRHAESARQDTAEWAAEQRRTIDAVIAELMDSARSDAESVRADALRTAMTDAEKTARQFVAQAAARGARDAEEIRNQAREILSRSASLVEDANASLRGLASTMSAYFDELTEQTGAMERLVLEAQERVEAHAVTKPLAEEDLEVALDEIADDTKNVASTPDDDAVVADSDEAEEDEALAEEPQEEQPVDGKEPAAQADEPKADKPKADKPKADKPKATKQAKEQAKEQGRPLGSLFRGHEDR